MIMTTTQLPVGPTDNDHITYAYHMNAGNQVAAADALVSCYEALNYEDGLKAYEEIHEKRRDGSCRCGRYAARLTLRQR
jgi:hypothetical protein